MIKEDLFFGSEGNCRMVAASNMVFPTHLHRTFEVLRVVTGEVKTVIDGSEYTVSGEECIVVFPFQLHSFSVAKDSRAEIYVFSPDLVPELGPYVENGVPTTPVFRLEKEVFTRADMDNIFSVKALFYDICAKIYKNLHTAERTRDRTSEDTFRRALLYIESNYTGDCTLKGVAKELNYDYSYISKLFSSRLSITFNRYVNLFRVNRSCYLLIENKLSVTEIARMCGFDSVRTFNRQFRAITGTTPAQYREMH